jgi:hypothetical protein
MQKPVYNERYYKIKALLKNEDFQSDIAWLKSEFAKYDIPIPEDGFASYKEYLKWNEKFWQVWSTHEHSDEIKDLWKSFANPEDNKIYGTEEMDKFEAEKANLVPPIYGQYLRDVATKYGFDAKDEEIHEFLIRHVFLGKDQITDPSFTIVHERNDKTGKLDMFVKIFPWTVKDDIVKGWNFIRSEQEFIRKELDRNQEWKNFDRDYRIYELYELAREMRASGDKRHLDEITYSLYLKETNDQKMDMDNIKRIVATVRKRLDLDTELPNYN